MTLPSLKHSRKLCDFIPPTKILFKNKYSRALFHKPWIFTNELGLLLKLQFSRLVGMFLYVKVFLTLATSKSRCTGGVGQPPKWNVWPFTATIKAPRMKTTAIFFCLVSCWEMRIWKTWVRLVSIVSGKGVQAKESDSSYQSGCQPLQWCVLIKFGYLYTTAAPKDPLVNKWRRVTD